MQHTPTAPSWARRSAHVVALAAGALLAACGGTDEPQTGDVRIIYSFDAGTGAPEGPVGGLTPAPDGHFYGMTTWGGARGRGTLYRLTSDERFEVLHSFQGDEDGALPLGGSMAVADGGRAVYGVTHFTLEGPATYFRWSLDGRFTSFGYLGGGNDAAMAGVVTGSDGNLEVGTDFNWIRFTPEGAQTATPWRDRPYRLISDVFGLVPVEGGTFAFVRDEEESPYWLEFISHEGDARRVFRFDDASPLGQEPAALQKTRDGTILGYTWRGGAHGWGTLFQVSEAGVVTKMADLPKLLCGGFLEARDGQWYIITCEGPDAIERLSPDGQLTPVHTFTDFEVSIVDWVEHRPNRFYVVSRRGGAKDYGMIFDLVIAP